ncbi:hypothetical protein N7486_009667 [Penicillium sp. IBT 16267x]|nr:hypothetical protein N7486_009667 [Penicillium sp. IBT 16267x]
MDVEALKSQFSELCTVEEKKKVLIEVGGFKLNKPESTTASGLALFSDKIPLKDAFRKIEMHEERIKHVEFELESEKSSRRTFQAENVDAKAEVRRLNEINNRHPFIVVLVDGDGAKFLDSMLQSPEDGAAEASRRLTKADVAHKNKVIAFERDLHRFAERSTNSRAEFEFINVGSGKENADSKMNRTLNHFYRNSQCKKVFFAACHDNGYIHQLRDFIGDSEGEKRIVLVLCDNDVPNSGIYPEDIFQSFPDPPVAAQLECNGRGAHFLIFPSESSGLLGDLGVRD